jgi:hypothetical protein
MDNNIIDNIRDYLIRCKSRESRENFLDTLDQVEAVRIRGLENLFYVYPVGSKKLLSELSKRKLNFNTMIMDEIQREFYLSTLNEHQSGKVNIDHDELVEKNNDSYLFLLGDKFEKQLEASLRQHKRDEYRKYIEELKKQKQDHENELNKDNEEEKFAADKNRFGHYIRMAAYLAAASLLFFVIWQPFQDTNQEIYNKYATVDVSALNLVSTPGESTLRDLSEEHFKGLSIEETITATEAYSLYLKKEYRAAAAGFQKANIGRDKGSKLMIFQAITQMRLSQYDESTNTLDTILSIPDHPYNEDALYYKALVLIAKGERSKAKKVLRMIRESNGKYSSKAKEILSQIRWF